MSSTPVQRVLREGDDELEFNRRLDEIQEKDLHRLQVIEEVCSRLEFAELIKYDSRFAHHSGTGERLNRDYQIDRLVTHLALTSLDIIAREQFSNHEFPDSLSWLLSVLTRPKRPPSVDATIDALDASRNGSSLEVLKAKLPCIVEDCLDEEGVGRLFKRPFREAIDPWMREWLCSVFILAKNIRFDNTISPLSLEWTNLKTCDRIAIIADYLYSLRNQYTHSSSYADTQELSQFKTPFRDSRSFSIRYSNLPDAISGKVKWFVALRSDLAESEVVRMILVHLMRKWLGYHDGSEFPESYFSRLTFRLYTYSFDHELVYNSSTIGRWALIESSPSLLGRFDLQSFLLSTTYAANLRDLLPSTASLHPFTAEQLGNYLELASQMNNHVRAAFSQEGSTGSDGSIADHCIRSTICQLAASSEAMRLLYVIEDLRQAMDQTLSIPFY